MLMEKFWVVVNPKEESTMQDICFETTPVGYVQYCLGGTSGENPDRLEKLRDECHAFHTSERTARADAEGRMQIRAVILKSLSDHQARIKKMGGE